MEKNTKKKIMDSLKGFLKSMKNFDEDIPEELAENALEMTEEIKDAFEEEEKEKEKLEIEDKCKDEEKEEIEEKKEVKEKSEDDLEEMIEKVISKILVDKGLIKDKSLNSLDKLEEEILESSEDKSVLESEEEVTVDPEEINDKELDSGKKLSDSAKVELIKKVRPIIATIPKANDRRKISDAFALALRTPKKQTANYNDIIDIAKANIKDNSAKMNSDENLGEEIAKKYNPHYMEKK